jgi:hypothetical protein
MGIIEEEFYREQIKDDLRHSFQAVICRAEFAVVAIGSRLCARRRNAQTRE